MNRQLNRQLKNKIYEPATGCTVFEVSVHPTNWNTKKANVKEIWYINFLFKDPNFIAKYPFGKQIRIKGGINRVKNLKDKQDQISLLRDKIIAQLEGGYNPITDSGDSVVETSSLATLKDESEPLKMVAKDTPFIIALEFALGKIDGVPAYLMDIKSALRYVEIAAKHFGYQNMPIYDIHTDHISNILEYCRSTESKIAWSNKRSNKVKGELGGLFRYLIEKNAASYYAPRDVRKLNEEDVDFERQTMTDEEITIVKDYLYKNNRPFYKFMMIFYYSGSRMIELMRLKGCNVDLKKQVYRTEVKKGGISQISRIIVEPALEFLVEQMENCGPDDYVFSQSHGIRWQT